MILVDIQVPVLDRVYDFELEEEMQVGEALEEILTLIAAQEQVAKGDERDAFLYAVRQETILSRDRTFLNQGLREGDGLILI